MKKCLTILSLMALVGTGSLAIAADAAEVFTSSCSTCHGVDGSKSAGDTVPVKEQSAEELLKKLKGYAAGTYGGKNKAVMEKVAEKHAADLSALAEYMGTL